MSLDDRKLLVLNCNFSLQMKLPSQKLTPVALLAKIRRLKIGLPPHLRVDKIVSHLKVNK
jgi:hypothetical protein